MQPITAITLLTLLVVHGIPTEVTTEFSTQISNAKCGQQYRSCMFRFEGIPGIPIFHSTHNVPSKVAISPRIISASLAKCLGKIQISSVQTVFKNGDRQNDVTNRFMTVPVCSGSLCGSAIAWSPGVHRVQGVCVKVSFDNCQLLYMNGDVKKMKMQSSANHCVVFLTV